MHVHPAFVISRATDFFPSCSSDRLNGKEAGTEVIVDAYVWIDCAALVRVDILHST